MQHIAAMALHMKSLMISFRLYFSLWIHFLTLFFKQIVSKRCLFKVIKREVLGRTLFSGNYDKKKGVIKPSAFMIKDASKGMSVSRLSYAPKIEIDFGAVLDNT